MMASGVPYVRCQAMAARSQATFDAAYGEVGSSGCDSAMRAVVAVP